MKIRSMIALLLLAFASPALAQGTPYTSGTFGGLKFRSIGPAVTSGRVSDIAVDPTDPATYFVAAASGGVWKTVNGGTTYEPIFDGETSYSIGVVTVDPSNPHTVWVGTGENNVQRVVGYGDGVYKSVDGGASWKNMGLKESQHIGKIVVDPRNSNVVYVAAQGPLWTAGGDRGLYKTTDGGATWTKVLQVSDKTGVNEVVMDPRDSNVLYASAWQRARAVWGYIAGGPESALYRSTDAGATWQKVTRGLPSGEVGRIGLCVSPVDPDYVYAIIEAGAGRSGFYRSTDRGASWSKRSSYSTSGNYYSEIFCDPALRDRIYSMDVYAQVTDDGGTTFRALGEKSKHVDNHAMWIDPRDNDHYLMGGDGGMYESWDRAQTWQFKPNLPITQFYRVAVDLDTPFYNVYGGTQDNYSLGGPARTKNAQGIVNSDWFVTNGGDGFYSQVDPKNPDIVYAESQYGGLVRYDRKSGEAVSIQPLPEKGEPGLRWNWDSPLLISPHSNTRIYFAANRVFRSDDRGDSWKAISPDLSRGLDRNTLPIMGQVWSVDAVAKNTSTSFYGNIVAFDESPVGEGLLVAGTDDGLIHITENAGGDWRKLDVFPGVPDRTYVNEVLPSRHDRNTIYAAFNNYKSGDFKPYLLRSKDLGRSWVSIAGDLPVRGSVYAIAEDPKDPQLLFVGTEFGFYFTRDGGTRWVQLKNGLPPVAVRDIAIQPRENDLVLATFGRGFYVLDDYTPLRHASSDVLAKDATIFPVKPALAFIPATPIGDEGKGFQGESYFNTPNPPVAAVFTYYLKDSPKTRKAQRQEAEKELIKANKPVPYPSFDQLRGEDSEEAPYLLFTVSDMRGEVVRRLRAEPGTGVQRISWDLRYPSLNPVADNASGNAPAAGLVAPGKYRVALSKVIDGIPSALAEPVEFEVVSLNNTTLPAQDRPALVAFQQQAGELQRQLRAAGQQLQDASVRIRAMKEAIRRAPRATEAMLADARKLELRALELNRVFNGDESVANRQFETPPTMSDRLGSVLYASYSSTSAPGGAQQRQLAIVREEMAVFRPQLDALLKDVRALEVQLDSIGAPYTRGR